MDEYTTMAEGVIAELRAENAALRAQLERVIGVCAHHPGVNNSAWLKVREAANMDWTPFAPDTLDTTPLQAFKASAQREERVGRGVFHVTGRQDE